MFNFADVAVCFIDSDYNINKSRPSLFNLRGYYKQSLKPQREQASI